MIIQFLRIDAASEPSKHRDHTSDIESKSLKLSLIDSEVSDITLPRKSKNLALGMSIYQCSQQIFGYCKIRIDA